MCKSESLLSNESIALLADSLKACSKHTGFNCWFNYNTCVQQSTFQKTGLKREYNGITTNKQFELGYVRNTKRLSTTVVVV